MNSRVATIGVVLVAGMLALGAEKASSPTSDASEIVKIWQQRYADFKAGVVASDEPAISKPAVSAKVPNQPIVPPPPPGENHNASIAWSDVTPGEAYEVFNWYIGPGFTPKAIGHAWTPVGATAPMMNLGPVPLTPPFTQEWNPSISGHPMGGYLYASTGHTAAMYGGPAGILVHAGPGAGAAFGPTPVPPLMMNVPGATWVDYPMIEMDDNPANPPIAFGTAHVAWVGYLAGDPDLNGDGNPFNEPADAFNIWYSYSHTLGGPPPVYPAFSPPLLLNPVPMPMMPFMSENSRPAITVIDPPGTPLPVAIPPGGVYIAWTDGFVVWVDASPAPAFGAPFGALTGGAGPLAAFPVTAPMPPVIAPGVRVASQVDIAFSPAGLCPGALYIVWTDNLFGDLDIFMSTSMNGGLIWTPAVRVNQDPIASGRDQWGPKIIVNDATGGITVVYRDRRNDPLNIGYEVYASTSANCGATWADILVSNAGNVPPISTQMILGAAQIGTYLSADFNMINGPGFSWNDGRNGVDQDVIFEVLPCPDADFDGFAGAPCGPDCDDTNPAIFPGAIEIPDNAIDEDCNGFDAVTCYKDNDFDGFGDLSTATVCPMGVCCIPGGVSNGLDCDDTNPGVNPLAIDICNGIDDNCDGLVDGGDSDLDGIANACDNCPATFNPAQVDMDGDGRGDLCDACPLIPNPIPMPCPFCCAGTTGNCDCTGIVDIADLTALIDYLFITFTPLCCSGEGNVDASLDCIIDISDLTTLIDFLFITFTPLPVCAPCP